MVKTEIVLGTWLPQTRDFCLDMRLVESINLKIERPPTGESVPLKNLPVLCRRIVAGDKENMAFPGAA